MSDTTVVFYAVVESGKGHWFLRTDHTTGADYYVGPIVYEGISKGEICREIDRRVPSALPRELPVSSPANVGEIWR